MRSKISLGIAGGALIVVLAGGGYWLSQRPTTGGSAAQDFGVMATPPGITLQEMARGRQSAAAQLMLADAKGMTLYTYDKDVEPNKSACTGDCIKAWPAAAAPANAKPVGEWSIVSRDDGTRQWAYKGKPLYTFIKDKVLGSIGGNAPVKGFGRGPGDAAPSKVAEMPKDWHAATYQPTSSYVFPSGIALQEVPDAFGQVLVNDHGMTLYAFNGDVKNDKQTCVTTSSVSCANPWLPFAAAEIANPVGGFSIVVRPNGMRQWAYKGHPLYTFSGDIVPGEAHGIGADKSWHVAALERYFTPAGVTVGQVATWGDTLADANGMTIYRRDVKTQQSSGRGAKNLLGDPPVGRTIGLGGCDADCLKAWHPVPAAADAQSSGYWDVLTREDGTKQWAYKGYALYTYGGDKKPGDMTGNDIYDLLVNDDLHHSPYAAIPIEMASFIPNAAFAIYWIYAAP